MAGDFAHMNVFFVVTTIAVVVVTALLIYTLYKLIRILNDVKHVSENISEESDNLRGDIAELREKTKREGLKLAGVAGAFRKTISRWLRFGSKKRHIK